MTHILDLQLSVDLTGIFKEDNISGAMSLLGASDPKDFLLKYSGFLRDRIMFSVSDLDNIKFVGGSLSEDEQSGFFKEDKSVLLNGKIDNDQNHESIDKKEFFVPPETEVGFTFEEEVDEAMFNVRSQGGEIQDIIVSDVEYANKIISTGRFENVLLREELPFKAVVRYKDLLGKLKEESVDL